MKTSLGIVLLVASTQAFAWGPREQGALVGAIGGLVVGGAVSSANSPHYGRIPPPPVVYREQQQQQVVITGNSQVIIIQNKPVVPHYTPIPGGYMDNCQYRNQQAHIYDQNGTVIGWRYCR